MKRYISFFIFAFIVRAAFAVEVPEEIHFAGMDLKLTEEVRRKLKADIELITKSQKGFQIKLERANLYFPIIERIFKEENLPDDFKFLSLQESALVSDAVSSSNAVGYWQFKKETAIEVGLRVDNYVDERINIVSSSRGAAKYLKKNNGALDNWIYALLSYNVGLGGVKSMVKEKYLGSKKMVIDRDIHWYVIRFLAHKLAYQEAVGKDFNPTQLLLIHDNCERKSMVEISNETEIAIEKLYMYNKWLLKGNVPDDKEYFVILPVTPQEKEKLIAKNVIDKGNGKHIPKKEEHVQKVEKKKRDSDLTGTSDVALITFINRIKTIRAKDGDDPATLAIQGGISVEDFLRYNDLKSFDQIVPGEQYYLQPKRSKGLVFFHTVETGESLRDISQKYGIKIDAIRNKNRMDKREAPVPGRVLWLRSKRPQNVAVEIKPQKAVPETTESKPEKDSVIIPLTKQEFSVNEIVESIDIQSKHIVKAGETLYGISKVYAVAVDSIKIWNGLASNEIKLGQELIIRNKTSDTNISMTEYLEHFVQQGETLFAISRKYGVSVTDIQKWNNKIDPSVSIGEKLLIRKK